MSASIETIAQMVGCSTATVSRVINNTDTVSNHMRQAILKAIRETNYVPRKRLTTRPDGQGAGIALGNRSQLESQSRHIAQGAAVRPALVDVLLHWQGAIEHYSVNDGRINVDYVDTCADYNALQNTERITNSFFRTIIDGICSELPEWGYRPVLQTISDLRDTRRLQALCEQSLDGVVIAGQSDALLSSFLQGFRRPVVLADVLTDGNYPLVTIDNQLGMALAFRHLFEAGHRNIGFLLGAQDNPVYAERFAQYRFHMLSNDLQVRDDWVYRGFTQVSGAAAWAHQLFAGSEAPTAFMSSNDICALGILRAASELGISVPQQLSVIGFDDVDAASVVTPALTTIRVPAFELGREAARQLVLHMGAARPLPATGRVVVAPELVVRSSTCPVA